MPNVRIAILVLASFLLTNVVYAQEFTVEKQAKAKVEYSPYINRSFPQRVYWGDTHLHTTYSPDAGIIGNFNTWSHKGKQQIGVLSGVGGWAGIGVATQKNYTETDDQWGLGALGGYRHLKDYTQAGGVLTVWQLP